MRQAVFLDRDGTINRNDVRNGKPYAPTRFEDFEILPGVAEAITRFHEAGYLVIVITNQPDLATGKQSADILEAMHDRLRNELGVDDIFVCPHTDEHNCDCRKPSPGLLHQAAREWNIDLSRSAMVGDRWRDVDAGRAAGCFTVHIDHGYAAEPRPVTPDLTVHSLVESVSFIREKLGSDEVRIDRG